MSKKRGLNSRQRSILYQIEDAFDYHSVVKDKKGNVSVAFNHSITIRTISDVNLIKETFPQFKVSNLYLDWYIVGFSKPANWGDQYLPR
jgi:hypothetical protein